ncbi:hypothetical protein DL98DRAFT_543089 [Cadophora sp. DSE1049]|nr:hypothetical protein DL98DRAFT_543089 [Cadophora sp. DSE1049]
MTILPLYRKISVFFICSLPIVATTERVNDSLEPFILLLSNCTIPPSTNFPDGVDSWGLQLSIASQHLFVVPSTIVNNTVITETAICMNGNTSERAQCNSRRGGTFDFRQHNSGYCNISIQPLAPDDAWTAFNPPFSGAGSAVIQFPSEVTALGFSLFAGSQSVAHPRDGHIVFGGYDSTLIGRSFTNYTMSNIAKENIRSWSLQVDVLNITLRRPNLTDIAIQPEGNIMAYCIEPYDNLFRFPSDVTQLFRTSTDWKNDSPLVPPDLYVVEPGLNYNTSFNSSLVFTLQDGLEVEIPSYELATVGGCRRPLEEVFTPYPRKMEKHYQKQRYARL